MPDITTLSPAAPWVELRSTESDWTNADSKVLGTLLSHMHLVRAFEETVIELAMEGLVHGPAHSSIGQEGGAAGALAFSRPAIVSAPTSANAFWGEMLTIITRSRFGLL